MVDFHTHILPQMDDGSKDVQQSLEMLRAYAGQNVDTIVMTPHFCRERESVECFLRRREASYLHLQRVISGEEGLSTILLGSEVRFYDGISRTEEIDQLCIGESRCLLLEMPFEKWNWRIINEVNRLLLNKRFIVILAHIEQYLMYQKSESDFHDLIEMGIVFQINTLNFKKHFSSRIVLKLLKIGSCFVLGTDCHNTTDRRPEFDWASNLISTKLGNEKLHDIYILSKSLLGIG